MHLLLAPGVVGVRARACALVPTEESSAHDFPKPLMLAGLNENQSWLGVSV